MARVLPFAPVATDAPVATSPSPRRTPLGEFLVRAGVLGQLPGFYGYQAPGGALEAMIMVGPQGGTALEVQNPAAYPLLAEVAASCCPTPTHIVGAEQITEPFWRE